MWEEGGVWCGRQRSLVTNVSLMKIMEEGRRLQRRKGEGGREGRKEGKEGEEREGKGRRGEGDSTYRG